MRAGFRAALLPAVLLLASLPAGAHGVGSRLSDSRAVVVDLHYSDGDAMSYADVQVFAPGDAVAFLHGRADRLGRAAFVPDRNGVWRIEARDAEGHLVNASVPVDGGASPGVMGAMGSVPAWMLWASLALNLFGAAQAWSMFRAGKGRAALA